MAEQRRAEQLVDQATEALREAIVAGRLRPGSRLVQEQLAHELGISRTPLREALRRLEQQGLVTVLGSRGLAVTEPSPEALLDTYDVREALDGLAARLAATRMAPGELAALQVVHRQSREPIEEWHPERWLAANAAFHHHILRNAHSPALERAMPVGRMSAQLLFPSVFLHQERARMAYEEHAAVVEALRARDPDAAETAARAHVARVREALALQLAQTPPAAGSGLRLRRLQVVRRAAGTAVPRPEDGGRRVI